MRRFVWLVIILAALWGGWWAFAAQNLRSGTALWLEDRRSEGWQAEATTTEVSGFPLALTLMLENPELADPETGVAFSTALLRLDSPAWWPGHVAMTLPAQSFQIASPEERRIVAFENAQANLRLRPGTALELEHSGVTSGPWQLSSPDGTIWGAGGFELSVQQSTDAATQYALSVNAPTFTPGGVIRSALRVPQDWPIAFDSLTIEGLVNFDRPIDRRAVEERRPQPRQIDLELAEAVWGTLSLRASAQLTVSEQGLATGQMSFQARNWQEILALAETAGVLPVALRPQLEKVLSALARGGGNPDAIDLTLNVRDSAIFLGFIPLGELHPLILR